MTLAYGLLFAFLVLVVFIPILAWNGRPKGFNRLNWIGTCVGPAIMAILFLAIFRALGTSPPYELIKVPEIARRFREQSEIAEIFFFFGALFCSLSIGSLVSVFLFRPRQ